VLAGWKLKTVHCFPKRISVICTAVRTVLIAVITEVLDFYNRHGVFLLRRSTAQAISRRWSPASRRPWGVAMRHLFLWIRWLHVNIIQSVWGLLEEKTALGHPRSQNNSDFPCQYHSLAFHMRSVMEKGALIQVSVWVVWPSADCHSFSPLEICSAVRGAMTNFSPCIPVVLCHCFFYVLLTVHLGIILVNNQFDAQFFFRVCLFQISTCFEHSCAHHQEN
jgi:hypothetical protein